MSMDLTWQIVSGKHVIEVGEISHAVYINDWICKNWKDTNNVTKQDVLNLMEACEVFIDICYLSPKQVMPIKNSIYEVFVRDDELFKIFPLRRVGMTDANEYYTKYTLDTVVIVKGICNKILNDTDWSIDKVQYSAW